MNDFEVEVCKALSKRNVAVHDEEEEEQASFSYYGDEYYSIAKSHIPFFGVTPTPLKKISLDGLKKKDRIIKENTMRLIETTLSRVNFDMKTFFIPPLMTSKTLELRGICFMYMCIFYTKNVTKNLLLPFSVIVSVQRFLNKIKGSLFSKQAEEDLQKYCDLLIQKYSFSGESLYTHTPSLIGSSQFDVFVPKMQVRPYEHQTKAMSLLDTADFVKSGFVCIYSTSTNSGKTFTAVGLASRVEKIKSQRFLFCCDIALVRKKVQSLFTFCNYSNALVCSLEEGYEVLTADGDKAQNYILFIDEITLNAHFKSETLKKCMRLFSVAPKWTYLSGANLDPKKMDFFGMIHSMRYSSSQLVTISSNTIFSSVSVSSFDGLQIVPHMNKKTVAELTDDITSILQNQFKGRMYTPTNVGVMLSRAFAYIDENKEKALLKSSFPDVKKVFSNVTQLYADNIRKIAMDILQTVVEMKDDALVAFLCKDSKETNETNDAPMTKQKKVVVDLLQLEPHLYPNINLVAHPDPFEFAKVVFKKHLDTIQTHLKNSWSKKMQVYYSALDSWKKQKSSEVDKIKDDKQRAIALTNFSPPPTFPFPDHLQLNTKEYCQRLGVTLEKYRVPLALDDKLESVVDDENLLLLLYSGVGIYSSKVRNKKYSAHVLQLISEGRLEFLFTDVCYGFDYPFGCLFISKEFSDAKSTTDIYQLMSRIGRGRLSYCGQVYMDKSCAEKIFSRDITSLHELENMYDVLINQEWEKEEK
jgi:hypothetical protein